MGKHAHAVRFDAIRSRRARVLALGGLLAATASCGRRPETPAAVAARPVVVKPAPLVPCPAPPIAPAEVDVEPPARPPTPPWTAEPSGARRLVFRSTLVGRITARPTRTTWTLLTSGARVLLRVEEQETSEPFHRVDRMSVSSDAWRDAARTEYAGETSGAVHRLRRTFGARKPEELVLTCAPRTIAVHPMFATLEAGWKNMDDSEEPAAWAPPRTERVQAIGCKADAVLGPFTKELAFVAAREATPKTPALAGVDWAFDNSDTVIQEGGYRWLPDFALAAP